MFCLHYPRSIRNLFRLIGVLLALMMVVGCSQTKGDYAPSKSVPVMTGSVILKDVPVQLRVFGNVQAYTTVSVKSLVGGELINSHFTEGQDVKKGDLLFTVDPRPYEVAVRLAEANLAKDLGLVKQAEANLAKDLTQVKQAEANLARDTAQWKNANAQAERYKSLIEKQVVSQQQYDQMRTNADALEATLLADKAAIDNATATTWASQQAVENAKATVQADRASLENAKIQLGYCTICSPIEGRTGDLLVDRGSIIKSSPGNDPSLVVINQTSPIYVVFSVPEQNLPEIKKYMAIGKLKVEAIIPGDEKRPEEGVLTFVDNTVDSTTGMIQLKGTFLNKERRLWPGQFVNIVLTLTVKLNAVVVPTEAIQSGQEGQYVFIVKPDLTVESRPVVAGSALDNETVIEKGLNPGEKVVTNGQLQLSPGTRVEIKNSTAALTSKENTR